MNNQQIGGRGRFEDNRLKGRVFALLMVLVAVVGCGDGDHPHTVGSRAVPTGAEPDTDYSLKVLVGPPGNQHQVRIHPADLSIAENAHRKSGPGKPATQSATVRPGLRTLAGVDNGSGTPIDTVSEDEKNSYASGWTLLLWAARSCYKKGDAASAALQTPLEIPDGKGGPYQQVYIFYDLSPLSTCDSQLFAQETLACAADRLAQIGDSVGTVTWDSYNEVDGEPLAQPIQVTVPPQAQEDKFIAMDMAMNALAYVSRLDVRLESDKLCAAKYLDLAQNGDDLSVIGDKLGYFPVPFKVDPRAPLSISSAEARQVGAARLAYRANILSASARLLHDLVERSVRYDLAGAEKRAAAAADPIRGAELRWGAPDIAGGSPYNTHRHALRVLYGRLEIGRDTTDPLWTGLDYSSPVVTVDDPRCSRAEGADGTILNSNMGFGAGFSALESLDALGPGHTARWAERAPKTAHESLALSIMDRAGTVFPWATAGVDIRGAVQAQVLRDRAAVDHRTYSSTLDASDVPAVNVLNEVAEADFEFANRQLYSVFRVLTDAPDQFEAASGSLDQAALSDRASAMNLAFKPVAETPEVYGAGGVVLAGGMPRGDLAVDMAAQLGGAEKSSQCGMKLVHDYSDQIDTSVEPGLHPGLGAIESLQSSFALGQMFRRRLAWTREAINAGSVTPDLERVAQFSASSVAEIAEWAGLLSVSHHFEPSTGDTYDVAGVPTDQVNAFKQRLVLTLPKANVAECVAGQRQSCAAMDPTGGDFFRTPISADVFTTSNDAFDGNILRFVFPSATKDSYLVLRPSAAGAGDGRVLAYMRVSWEPSQYFWEVVSPRRQQLANEVFGVSQSQQTERTCTDLAPISVSKNYCIKGMTRDMFVPLANELTSTESGIEDSWKHYLDLAEQSAAKADEIGRELIAQGIQSDLRQEGAVEAVGEQCGTYPNVDEIEITDGKVGKTVSDAAVNACINVETYDMVYLRSDPFAKTAADARDKQLPSDPDGEGAATALIRSIYCASDAAERPAFCAKPASEHITHAGLDFFTGSIVQDQTLAEACGDLTRMLAPRASQSDPLPPFDSAPMHSVESAAWASQAGLAAAMGSLKLVETPDRNWILSLGSTPLIATYEGLHKQVFGNGPHPEDKERAAVKDTAVACNHFNNCSDRAQFISSLFPNPDSSDSFANALRREVERTLFYLGSLAGRVPDGVFTIPLPVANRTVIPQDRAVPAPALYAASQFEKNTSQVSYNIAAAGNFHGRNPWSADDDALLLDLTPLESAAFATDRASTGVDWRDEVYAQAAEFSSPTTPGYLLASTSNTELTFNESLIAHPADDADAARNTRNTLPQWLESIAQRYAKDPTDPSIVNSLLASSYYAKRRFFIDKKALMKEGREVCVDAPISPVFFQTDPTWATNTRTATVPFQGSLFVTDTAVNNADNWFSISQTVGLPSGSCLTGQQCRTPYDPIFDWVVESPDGCTAVPHAQWEVWGSSQLKGHTEPLTVDDLGNPITYHVIVTDPGCANMDWENARDLDPTYLGAEHADWIYGEKHRITHDRLRPTVCPPGQRVEMFLDTKLESSSQAMETLVRALGLSCASWNLGPVAPSSLPPPIKTEDDIQKLAAWVGGLASVTTAAASTIYVVNLPKSVVAHVKSGDTGIDTAAASQGTLGKHELELEEHLRDIERTISSLGTSFSSLRGEIEKAELSISGATDADKARQLEIAARALENDRMMAIESGVEAHAMISAAASIGSTTAGAIGGASATQTSAKLAILGGAIAASGGTGAVVVMGAIVVKGLFDALGAGEEAREQIRRANINLRYGKEIKDNLTAQGANSTDSKNVDVNVSLTNLNLNTSGIYQQIQEHLTGIQNSTSDAQQSIIDISQDSDTARIALAKASGADFVTAEGSLVPLHVNTIYRRQFDVLALRYERALDSAKRAAYLARLSIEERLGTRLDDLQQDIGPLQAPKLWVDSLCSVQGIDYSKLRTAQATGSNTVGAVDAGASGASPKLDLVQGFADQYIGDYVAKLREFVEFYNVEYPFRDANDTAIVSLREDVRNGEQRCLATSNNLLFHSDQLEAAPSFAGEDKGLPLPGVSIGGWRTTGCDASACLIVQSGGALTNPTSSGLARVEPPALAGSPTWLYTVAPGADQHGGNGLARGSVYQTVALSGGKRYVLSWWDMARAIDGGPYADSAAPNEYSVAVYDSNWSLIALDSLQPTKSGSAGTTWSRRNTLQVEPSADGNYHVAITAAGTGVVNASVAIANVQLEVAPGNSQVASVYVSNRVSRTTYSGNCPVDSPEAFRGRFDFVCEASGDCYHQMRDPLIIDEQLLNQGNSSLITKVGPGNFNYRNDGLALNIVGTGVIDCSRSNSSSCSGSAYTLYDLSHVARDVPISDYLDKTRCFDFGIANIRGGKALTAERFITLPTSSTDRDLINQPAFLKSEFTGRPLSGSYRIRIKDSPTLAWDHVDDVQVVLNYHYWSRVDRGKGL